MAAPAAGPRLAYATLLTDDSFLPGAQACIATLLAHHGSHARAASRVRVASPVRAGSRESAAGVMLQDTEDVVHGEAAPSQHGRSGETLGSQEAATSQLRVAPEPDAGGAPLGDLSELHTLPNAFTHMHKDMRHDGPGAAPVVDAPACSASTAAAAATAEAVGPAPDVDFVVMVTPSISKIVRARLLRTHARVRVREVAHIAAPAPKDREVPVGWTSAAYTKLAVWSLVEYEKVVYVDADAIAVDDVAELFERPGAPRPAAAPDVFPPDKFNAGVLVVEPDAAVFAGMLQRIEELPSHDGGDTGFLNAFYSDWYESGPEFRLPFRYNAQRTLHWFTYNSAPGYWDACKPLKIIHYSSIPKPWAPDTQHKKGDLELLWWQAFMTYVQKVPVLP